MKNGSSLQPTTIVIAGPHPLTIFGLRSAISTDPSFLVIAETLSGKEAVRLVDSLKPDILLLDPKQRDFGGIEILRELRVRRLAARIVIYSDEEDPWAVRSMLASGALGYLAKTATSSDIIEAVRSARENRRFLQTDVALLLARLDANARAWEKLSKREVEVLAEICTGQSNEDIANRLSLAPRTVEMHVGNVLSKLGVRSRTQAALVAVKSGLVAYLTEPNGDVIVELARDRFEDEADARLASELQVIREKKSSAVISLRRRAVPEPIRAVRPRQLKPNRAIASQ